LATRGHRDTHAATTTADTARPGRSSRIPHTCHFKIRQKRTYPANKHRSNGQVSRRARTATRQKITAPTSRKPWTAFPDTSSDRDAPSIQVSLPNSAPG
jgi:hypothetical protein